MRGIRKQTRELPCVWEEPSTEHPGSRPPSFVPGDDGGWPCCSKLCRVARPCLLFRHVQWPGAVVASCVEWPGAVVASCVEWPGPVVASCVEWPGPVVASCVEWPGPVVASCVEWPGPVGPVVTSCVEWPGPASCSAMFTAPQIKRYKDMSEEIWARYTLESNHLRTLHHTVVYATCPVLYNTAVTVLRCRKTNSTLPVRS
ncbi:hypothetical protein EGW08_015406 [Elysia chlorotica]|uniref:Uncharacterized protein n=1 Tax=Elysia chlorotica TaxID=188477 RepID=A0A3S0ZE44_ELYCH|nr:hypothetical protein EGW08_015406 [Elysia chlorotica]